MPYPVSAVRDAQRELRDMRLVPGFWCQVRRFGWLPGSPTACTDENHRHVKSDRNPAMPGHSVVHAWRK